MEEVNAKNENNIIIYQDENGITKVTVRFVDEDIWLTQNQIAEIYETTQQNVSLHINNIYKDKELEQNSTHKEFLLVQKEGNIIIVIFKFMDRKRTLWRIS